METTTKTGEVWPPEENQGHHVKTYYEKIGQFAHDHVLRCVECKKLSLHSAIAEKGGCSYCGNRRVTEVRSLNLREALRIKLGLLKFPYSDLFMAEFFPDGLLRAVVKGVFRRG